jgi:hypothetical protein
VIIMRNFVPLSLFAVAASLAALSTSSFQADRLASAPPAYGFAPAAAGTNEPAGQPAHESPVLHLTVPHCKRNEPCAIRRPMT